MTIQGTAIPVAMRIVFAFPAEPDLVLQRRTLSVVPRVGDEVIFGYEDSGTDRGFTVRDVRWYLDEPDFDVHIVLQ